MGRISANSALAALAGALLGWESLLWAGPFSGGQAAGSAWWSVPAALLTGAGLLALHPRRARLDPAAVVGAGVALHLGSLALHLGLGGPGDQDVTTLYPELGAALRATGALPPAEYPPLALLAFAAAGALGPVRVTLPLLTLPLLAAGWAALARRGPDGTWAAACVALWPTLVPFWEVKYDALPAALLLLGLLAGGAGRAGALLGLGAAAKWFPGLAVPVLAAGLLGARRPSDALRLCAAAAGAVALVHLPFLNRPEALLTPYRFHAARALTGESMPYLPLRALGLVDRPERAWFEVVAPAWAGPLSLAAVGAALVALAWAAARRPERATVLAAAAPAAFLLGNRVFSPQFLLPLALSWAVGMAGGRGARAIVVLLGLAATANHAVWPVASPAWELLSAVLFAAALTATAMTVVSPGAEGTPGPREGRLRGRSGGTATPAPCSPPAPSCSLVRNPRGASP